MKKISIVCLTGLLFFAACDNSGSSTIGTYEKEETSQSSEKSESESGGGQAKENTETTTTTTDTLKTSGDAPHEASGTEVKTGASVSVDSTKVNSKP